MRRIHGAGSDWSALLAEAARSLGVLPAPPPLPGLSDLELRLDFFGQTLDFAVLPHKSRRPLASGPGINSKSWPRGWIFEQICVDALRPEWFHRHLADPLGTLDLGPNGGAPIVRMLEYHNRLAN